MYVEDTDTRQTGASHLEGTVAHLCEKQVFGHKKIKYI